MRLKPGAGWSSHGSVWVHENGARVHLAGYMKQPNGSWHSIHDVATGGEGMEWIEVNGGNVKRGLMCWSRCLSERKIR